MKLIKITLSEDQAQTVIAALESQADGLRDWEEDWEEKMFIQTNLLLDELLEKVG